MTWGNTGTFAYTVSKAIQHKMEPEAVILDLKDVCNRVDFAEIIAVLEVCRLNTWMASWTVAALMERSVELRFRGWTSQPTCTCPALSQCSKICIVRYEVDNDVHECVVN